MKKGQLLPLKVSGLLMHFSCLDPGTLLKKYSKKRLKCLPTRPSVRPSSVHSTVRPSPGPRPKKYKNFTQNAISIDHSASDPAHHSGTNHPWWSACLMPEYRCHGLHQSAQSLWMPRSPYQGAKGVALCCEVLSWVVLCYIVLCVILFLGCAIWH